MKSKYEKSVRESIDLFWMNNHYPPTIRDLMEMVGSPSTHHISVLVDNYKDVRKAKHGRIIPRWVDSLFQNNIVID